MSVRELYGEGFNGRSVVFWHVHTDTGVYGFTTREGAEEFAQEGDRIEFAWPRVRIVEEEGDGDAG